MRPNKDKLLFELSYSNTSALFALREKIAPLIYNEVAEQIWEKAVMHTSRGLRK